MKKIDDLIRRYDHPWADGTAFHRQAKLKMIKALFEEIKDSRDCAYMEEIIAQFTELVNDMQDTINAQMAEIAKADGYGPGEDAFVAAPKRTDDGIPWDLEEEPSVRTIKEIPPILPPEGGYQTDDQVKKAFTNYLTYHVERRTRSGKEKPFSVHTVYDYSSRLKVLAEIVYKQWQEGNGDDGLQLSEQTLRPGCPFLNAYHNISALEQYVARKEQALCAMGEGGGASVPDGQKTPLDNIRNLRNTIAALAKFKEFKQSVTQRAD